MRTSEAMPSRYRQPALACLLALTLATAGCTTWQRDPLPAGPNLVTSVDGLTLPVKSLTLPGVQPGPFDLADGLDMTETAQLAVLNNPDLKAARARAQVGAAQVFAAGLLPDPQLSASLDKVTSSGPDLVNGYSYGFGYDIGALITHGADRKAAAAAASKIDLDLLWQEWQVAERARSLWVQIVEGRRGVGVLERYAKLYHERYRHSSTALEQGDVTLATAGVDLAAWLDADSRLAAARLQLAKQGYELRALLGVKPDTKLVLGTADLPAPSSAAEISTAIDGLAARRPDLVALRYGYASQEQKVRSAILAQFPAITVGINRASDTSDVHTTGFSIGLTLPLFSRNRGHIAIERATRSQLRAEYQARLDQSVSDLRSLSAEEQMLYRQLQALRKNLPDLQALADRANKAYRGGNLDAASWLTINSALLDKRLEAFDLSVRYWQARIGVDTLSGRPIKPPNQADEETSAS